MKTYRDQLLALVRALTEPRGELMTLNRLVCDTNPDPTKTSFNDTVTWRVQLSFGRGYFSGALVTFYGVWNGPHQPQEYSTAQRDLPLEAAVDAFLSDTIPEWAHP